MTEIKIPDATLITVIDLECDESTLWDVEYDCKVMSGGVVVFYRRYGERIEWCGQDNYVRDHDDAIEKFSREFGNKLREVLNDE